MEDVINKLSELEGNISKIVYSALEIDTSNPKNLGKVRTAWPTGGAPSWDIDYDVCFIRLQPKDSTQARGQDVVYSKMPNDDTMLIKETGYTRVHKINFTFCGPNAYDNADLLRFKLLRDTDTVKAFNKLNMHLITDISMPMRVPELFQGQWWERVDFSCEYNELVIRRTKSDSITAGNIVIETSR